MTNKEVVDEVRELRQELSDSVIASGPTYGPLEAKRRRRIEALKRVEAIFSAVINGFKLDDETEPWCVWFHAGPAEGVCAVYGSWVSSLCQQCAERPKDWKPAMVVPDPDGCHPKRDWEP
jgi:hypothetical protein